MTVERDCGFGVWKATIDLRLWTVGLVRTLIAIDLANSNAVSFLFVAFI